MNKIEILQIRHYFGYFRNFLSCVVCLLIQDSLPCLLGNQYSYAEPSQRIPEIVT